MKNSISFVMMAVSFLCVQSAQAQLRNPLVTSANGMTEVNGTIQRRLMPESLLRVLKTGGAEVTDETENGSQFRNYVVRSIDAGVITRLAFEVRLSSQDAVVMDTSVRSADLSVFRLNQLTFGGKLAKKLYMVLLAGGAQFSEELNPPTPAGNFSIGRTTHLVAGIISCDGKGTTLAPATNTPAPKVFACTISP